AEYVVHRPPRDRIDQARALDQSWAQHGMVEIRPRLLQRSDAIELRTLAETKAGQLREHEPHPVRGLAPGPQFGANLLDYRFLRMDEAVEVRAFKHGHHLL